MNKNYNIELIPKEVIKSMRKNIYYNYLHFTSYSNINQKYLSIRSSLFSLIHKISNKMNFRSNTYFLSIYFLDLIFLKNKNLSIYNDNYELLALACLVLASKHLENDPSVPHLQYYINAYNHIIKKIVNNYQSKNTYDYSNITFNDLMRSEVLVCKLLNYKLNYFTIYDFNSFFFGHGILKIEQLQDIVDDSNSKKNENNNGDNDGEDDELNYINPEIVKKILEKIYKRSRYYLDNIIKNKISLKYDSFLISIYIMYKSVEFVILKENRLINAAKNIEEYYLKKREEILIRKTSKCFKDIMNDIYKIDLDYIEEYQYLINDDDFLKIFYTLKYNNNNNKAIQDNNKNEFDISKRFQTNHKKIKSTNFNIEKENSNIYENNDRTIDNNNNNNKYSPKRLSHLKIPSAKYNKIRRLKILEKLNNNNTNNTNTNSNKNQFTKSFILKSKDNIPSNKINSSINASNIKKDILSKSNYNIEYNEFQYYNSNNNNNKIKTINTDNYNDYNENYIEPYKIENKMNINNNNSFVKNIKSKDSLLNEPTLYKFPTLKVERQKKVYNINLDNAQQNKTNFNAQNNSNKNLLFNVNQKLNKLSPKEGQMNILKPYSRKVIPKNEKKINNNQNINKDNNMNNYQKKNINLNKIINKNISFNENNIKNLSAKNYELRSSNVNKYKNNILEDKLNDSFEIQKDINSNYGRININMVKQIKPQQINTTNQYKKRPIPLIQNNNKTTSTSINKIKVNGVSNKNKLNKKLIYGLNKTPMKTEHNLRNALKRNKGVKRDTNISSLNKNSLDNSFEEENKNKEKNENKDYSIDLSPNNINNIDTNKKIVINFKNDMNRNKNNSNNNLMINKNVRSEEVSSSNDEEDYDDENNFKLNNIRIDQYEGGDEEKIIEDNRKNNINSENIKKYNIKKIIDKSKRKTTERNNPKIELIQINKKRAPTIVINNNFNVNFDNKTISSSRPFSKYKSFKIK